MTPSQWAKLRRGDRILNIAHPHHIHTILAINAQAMLINITGFAMDPKEWLQVNEDHKPVDETGRVIEPDCRMCEGAGAAHYDGAMQICPRCAGMRSEPANIHDQVIELRVWYPTGAEFPQVIFTAVTELHHGQLIELLTEALNILKAQDAKQFKAGGPGMVN